MLYRVHLDIVLTAEKQFIIPNVDLQTRWQLRSSHLRRSKLHTLIVYTKGGGVIWCERCAVVFNSSQSAQDYVCGDAMIHRFDRMWMEFQRDLASRWCWFQAFVPFLRCDWVTEYLGVFYPRKKSDVVFHAEYKIPLINQPFNWFIIGWPI